jgi:hypothetical protein
MLFLDNAGQYDTAKQQQQQQQQDHYATADEGEFGGTRGFTIWNQQGEVVYTSGIEMDREAQRVGQYPEFRSGKQGNEPENVEFAVYDDGDELLFVNSERSSLVFVYDVKNKSQPVLRQLLPAGYVVECAFFAVQKHYIRCLFFVCLTDTHVSSNPI